MIQELEQLDGLGAAMVRRARSAGVRLIWRAQARSVRRVVVRNGKPERSSISSASGHGVQVITPQGRVVLGNRDDFNEEASLALLDRTIEVASQGNWLGLTRAPASGWEVVRARELPENAEAFGAIDLAAAGERLVELERQIQARFPQVSLVLSFKGELDAWRIFRCDGTDVLFGMPRCTLGMRATSAGEGTRHGVSATVFSPRPDLLRDDASIEVFLQRAGRAAQLAVELPHAAPHAAGSFPLVIDYALAKGLAHEAFGHASEADSYRSSILATEGKLRVGDRVGADHVSIVDEPVEGDHAWQPFSANGLPRRRAVLVDHGRLRDGLSDPWSAEAGGVALTGAARSESFRHAPQPRMSNIRIEVDRPLPAPGSFESYGPREVRDLLESSGVFERHERMVYLSGYSGGQVNTATGDFVFQCKAIYDLRPGGITLFKPAIFSGSMLGALESVREAYGPLLLDAIGHCGKWGQSVPSSGGSHYFLVLDPHPAVRLGGR